MSAHHKRSLLYYLLLDYDDGLGVRSQLADTFARQTGLPKKYQIFMKGLWYMDHRQFHVRSQPPKRTPRRLRPG